MLLRRIQYGVATLIITVTVFLSGCASHAANPQDPYESYNRKMFKFNMAVDKVLYRPVAKVYDTITPGPVQTGVNNFFNNVILVPTLANDILQLNAPWLASDSARLIINTTLGIGGLFDVASHFGLEQHSQDFGLTLSKWGYRNSAYFIFPFLPPSSPRDLLGRGVDFTAFSVWAYIHPQWIGWTAYGLDFTRQRAALLSSDKLVREAFDPYVFIRDAVQQRRKAQINAVLHPKNDVNDPKSAYMPNEPDPDINNDMDNLDDGSSEKATGGKIKTAANPSK